MKLSVNVPTSVGRSEASKFPFGDETRWADQRWFGVAMEYLSVDGIVVDFSETTGANSSPKT